MNTIAESLTVLREIATEEGPHTLEGANGGSVNLVSESDRLGFIAAAIDSLLQTKFKPTDCDEDCYRCGGSNVSWFAPSPLWNAVIRGGSINGDPEYNDMVCATCFMILAEEKGIASYWKVDARTVNVELETVTPTGRVWNPETCFWMDIPEDESRVRVTNGDYEGRAGTVSSYDRDRNLLFVDLDANWTFDLEPFTLSCSPSEVEVITEPDVTV